MATTITTYGDSLIELTERLPQIDSSELWLDDRHPAEQAVETPFLRRIRAVVGAADPTLPVDDARRVVRETAPMNHFQTGSTESNERRLLHIAVRRGLLMSSETVDDQPDLWSPAATVQQGPYGHLLVGHPLAAVIEPWIEELSLDPVAGLDCDPRLQRSWQHAPFLIVQLLAVVGEIDVAQAVAALRREIGNAFRNMRLPWPLPNAVVALVLGWCVEFGVATWDGTIAKPGRARITQLGALAELAYRAHLGIDACSTSVPGCPTCVVPGVM